MVTKHLMSNEIEFLVSHILSLAAVFIVASANSVRIFLAPIFFLFYWIRVFPRMKQLFGNSGLLELAELLRGDLLVAFDNPGRVKKAVDKIFMNLKNYGCH